MKKITDDVAKALMNMPEVLIKWFDESLKEQLFENMTLEGPHACWGQGKAQSLSEVCVAIKDARKTYDRLSLRH